MLGLLINDEIFLFFHGLPRSPACFQILLRVPRGTSSDNLPETVTSPVLAPCLNWRWLPLMRTIYQPSVWSCLITSRTFIPTVLYRACSSDRVSRASRIICACSG